MLVAGASQFSSGQHPQGQLQSSLLPVLPCQWPQESARAYRGVKTTSPCLQQSSKYSSPLRMKPAGSVFLLPSESSKRSLDLRLASRQHTSDYRPAKHQAACSEMRSEQLSSNSKPKTEKRSSVKKPAVLPMPSWYGSKTWRGSNSNSHARSMPSVKLRSGSKGDQVQLLRPVPTSLRPLLKLHLHQ